MKISARRGAHSGATTLEINGEPGGGQVVWTLKDVAAGEEGVVTLKVRVLKGALKSNDGNGSVVNGGDTATVQVGGDAEFTLNTVEERDMKGVTEDNVQRFLKILQDRGVSATRRREMGDDIEGACGQLRRKTINGSKGETKDNAQV